MGPAPMSLEFWPGAVVMVLIATLTRDRSVTNMRGARVVRGGWC